MYGEYGYMEEGRLGKPYNLRLLRRLAPFALPYKALIARALMLTILITLLDLTLPYLSKIAIDRYILASWYRVEFQEPRSLSDQALLGRVGPQLLPALRPALYFVSHLDLKGIDPADLHTLRSRGVLKPERFYRIPSEALARRPAPDWGAEAQATADGAFMVSYAWLNAQPAPDILRIRAADLRGVLWVGLLFFGLLLASFGLGYAEYYLLELTGQQIMQDIRLQLFSRMQSQGLRFFDRQPVGRLVTRVTNDIENLNEMFKSVIITIFKDVFILAGILAVLLYLNWRLALLCFALIPFIFGITFLFSTLAREAFRELRATIAKINAFLQERLSGMRIIQLFVAERFQMEAFGQINLENYLAGMKQIRVFAVFMPLMELFAAFAVALLIWRGGGKVIGEELTLGALVAFLSYIQMFFKPIRDISEKYNIMQSAMASTERILEFMDLREEMPENQSRPAAKGFEGRIRFQDVSFAYDPGRPVLKEVSFEVRPGEMVAVVGPTGSGKTTLVNLIERFYDPERGSVTLDGADLRDWPQAELHRRVGTCMQDVFLFAGSLTDNLALGREGLEERSIEAAVRAANAWPLIQRLPRGLSEEIGEGGATLSAGERQLLSFARALAAEPQVLILDEATSSVDPETELLIQQAISRIVSRRTTLVVAHRLSTIRHADRILVMHRGRIREQGTHEELLALRGIYYRLNRLREANSEPA